MKVLLDANALMMPAQFQLDLFGELRELLGAYEPLILQGVRKELEGLSHEKGRNGAAARHGLSVGEKCTLVESEDSGSGTVDSQLIEYATRRNCMVVTNDRGVRDALLARGLCVISLRKQKKLEIIRR